MERISRRVTALLLLLLFATAAHATDYYVCPGGNDTSAGTSPATAWSSYNRAVTAFNGTLLAGDSVRFCRGGTFPIGGGTTWRNTRCRAAQPCTIGAYLPPGASADAARPRLVATATDAFDFTNGGTPTHEEGVVLRDLDIACTGCSVNESGIFIYNDIDDLRMQDLTVTGFAIGIHLAGARECPPETPACDRSNLRVSLLRSTIADNKRFGWLGSDSELLLADNHFLRNGASTDKEHNVYLDESGGAVHDVRLLRNELYRSAAATNGTCEGSPLSVHGNVTDLLIEGNTIREDVGAAQQGCWGIDLTGGYSLPEGFTRVTLRGNVVRNVGNTALAVANCVDCIVENNVIEHEQSFGTIAISAPAKTHESNDLGLTHLIVRNNSIFVSAPGSVGVKVDTEGTQHVVVSNAIRSTATTGTFSCLALDLATSAYTTVDDNVCSYVAGTGREWEHNSGALAAWSGASGFDTHSRAADPGFASAGTPNHDLRAASAAAAMVGAGHASSSAPTEFYGTRRAAPPDAGAFQLGTEAPIFRDGFEG